MTSIALALRSPDRRLRELAALCLLVGVLRTLDAVPRDTVTGLLEALVEEPHGR